MPKYRHMAAVRVLTCVLVFEKEASRENLILFDVSRQLSVAFKVILNCVAF